MDNNDKGSSWLSDLDNVIAENSKLALILMMQFIMMGLMVIGYMKMIDKVEVKVELPKTIKEEGVVVVGKEYANNKFFRMWGREDIEIVSSFNQKSIKTKMAYLKDRMYPPYYYKFEKLFKDYERQISTDLVSQKFVFAKEDIKVKSSGSHKKATVSITGFYSKTIDEDEIIKAAPCEYKMGYIIKGGHIYVESFKTTCK